MSALQLHGDSGIKGGINLLGTLTPASIGEFKIHCELT